MHKKPLVMMTTVPHNVTAHMELTCDHLYQHPPCTGREADGSARTANSSSYPPTLQKMIVGVAATLAGYSPPMSSVLPAIRNESFLAAAKLRNYWQRTKDKPEKRKPGIEASLQAPAVRWSGRGWPILIGFP